MKKAGRWGRVVALMALVSRDGEEMWRGWWVFGFWRRGNMEGVGFCG
jgi:hypothetical protein